MKNTNIIKKVISTALCAVMACSFVTGAGISSMSLDMAVTASAAETEEKLCVTEKDMLPYYYQKMTKSEKAVYIKLRKAVMERKSSAKFGKMSKETADKLTNTLFYYDDLGFNLNNVQYEIGPSYTKMKFEYFFSKSNYIKMVNKIDEKAEAIVAKFTDKTTKYAKIKYIHDYIIKNCTYNTEALTKDTAYGALVAKKADCDGYSKAFSYVCRKAGIWTVNVTGDSGEPHMWNKVYYNKAWHNVDVTWDDPTGNVKDNLAYDFFMISDKQISKTHTQDKIEYTVPSATTNKYGYYNVYKLIAKDANDARSKLISQIASAASKGKSSVTIQMPDDATYSNVVNYLEKNSSDNIFEILSAASKKTKAKLITIGCHGYGNPESRTYTICFYLKGKKITDYYTSLDVMDSESINFLDEIGLVVG